MRAHVVIASVHVAGAALALATGCISPPTLAPPEVEPHEVSFVATDDALAVLGDVPALFEDDAWIGSVDARAIHPPALRGGYLIGGDGACPLPADVRSYTLDEGVGFVPGARRVAPWIQRPEVAPLAFEISSTCGSGRDPWLISGSACGFVVSSADPGWTRRAFGLRDVRAPELLDQEARCAPAAAVGRAIASAECSDQAPSCHVDLFPPEPRHPFTKSAPLVDDADFEAFSRRVAVASLPFPAALKGLAFHGGWLRTLAIGDDVSSATAVAAVPASCVPRASLRSLDPDTFDEARAIPLPAPYRCGVAVFSTTVAPALYVLAQHDEPAAIDCNAKSGSPEPRAWAILRLGANGALEIVEELDAPCASRALLGRPLDAGAPLLIGLVQEDGVSRRGETWLAPFDAVQGRLVVRTTTAGVVVRTTTAGRELATLLPMRRSNAWLTYERGGGFTSFALGRKKFMSSAVDIIAQIPFGNRGPSGFTRFESGHVAAWFDRRSGGAAAWVTEDTAETETKIMVVGASWAPQEVTAIVPDWPRDEAARDTTRGLGVTISAAEQGRREVTLRPFERLSSVRARHRGVIAEVGRGPPDPETLVLDGGALVLVLGWEGTIVRVEPRPR